MKKTKLPPCVITSRESLESTVADIVRAKLEFAVRNAAMEREIADVQKRHQANLLLIARDLQSKEAGVYVYCQSNRAALFPEKKSIELLLATIGFELNPFSVEKLAKRDTWADIAARLAALDWGSAYVVDPEPAVSKSKLLADREKLTPDQLRQAGIAFNQEEQFYIRPKSEVAQETVTIKEAA